MKKTMIWIGLLLAGLVGYSVGGQGSSARTIAPAWVLWVGKGYVDGGASPPFGWGVDTALETFQDCTKERDLRFKEELAYWTDTLKRENEERKERRKELETQRENDSLDARVIDSLGLLDVPFTEWRIESISEREHKFLMSRGGSYRVKYLCIPDTIKPE